MSHDKPSTIQAKVVSTSSKGGIAEAKNSPTADGDIGLKIFDDYQTLAAAIDPKAERRLVRKIDTYIIPFICMTYLITYIDKATLSYGTCSYTSRGPLANSSVAAIFGLTKDLQLHGTQYSWLGSIFYFGYMFVSLFKF
jgi:hypothetical protein